MAHVYYDTKKYREALDILRPLVPTNFDRYVFQKLYAETNLKLGFKEEALLALRELVFLNPRDQASKDLLQKLEEEEGAIVNGEGATLFQGLEQREAPIEEWAQVDFAGKVAGKPEREEGEEEDVGVEPERPLVRNEEGEGVLATHTLVDLYRDQGLIHKAVEVLQKIVQRNPEDVSSREKLQQLKQDLASEASGQQDLMGLWEQRFSEGESAKKVLLQFLKSIQSRGREIREGQQAS